MLSGLAILLAALMPAFREATAAEERLRASAQAERAERARANAEASERDEAAERAQKAKTEAEAAAAERQKREQIIAEFSTAAFMKSLNSIDGLIRQEAWEEARAEHEQYRLELGPLLSYRGSQKDVVAASRRLSKQDGLISRGLERRGEQQRIASEQRQIESAIPARVLFSEFDANEIRANQAYKGKEVRVRGSIESIATDILGTPYLTLKTNSIFSVQAMFAKTDESRLANLSPGEMVIVRCTCGGKFGNVLLRNCGLE